MPYRRQIVEERPAAGTRPGNHPSSASTYDWLARSALHTRPTVHLSSASTNDWRARSALHTRPAAELSSANTDDWRARSVLHTRPAALLSSANTGDWQARSALHTRPEPVPANRPLNPAVIMRIDEGEEIRVTQRVVYADYHDRVLLTLGVTQEVIPIDQVELAPARIEDTWTAEDTLNVDDPWTTGDTLTIEDPWTAEDQNEADEVTMYLDVTRVEYMDEHNDAPQQPHTDVVRTFMDNLDGVAAEMMTEDCSICRSPLANEDTGRAVTLPCHHTHCFHAACIAPWFEEASTCPACRAHFAELQVPSHLDDDEDLF